jgi:Putative peptidoglycan binding domain
VARVRRWIGVEVRRRLGSRRARRLLLPLGALALVALAIGLIVDAELPATSRGANPPAGTAGAATVKRRDLVQTDTESGTLGYARASTVYNRVSGTITWLPSVGQEIKPGATLYEVDNSPVVLFDGTTPAYRGLSAGVSNGPDVAELNRNLVKLGFADGEIALNDTWQVGTTDAVLRWQASLGEPQTGVITLGQVVFLPGPQLVTTVDTVLGSTGGTAGSGASGSGAGSGSATGASLHTSTARAQFVSLTTTTPASGPTGPTGPTGASGPTPGTAPIHPTAGSSTTQLKALIALLQAEIAELRSARHSTSTPAASTAARAGSTASKASARSGGASPSSASGAGGGSAAGAGAGSSSGGGGQAQAIMQTTSPQEVVTVQLDATKQSEAVVGEGVTVQLPDGSVVDGKITQVSPVAQSSSSNSGSGSSGGGGGGGGGSSSSPSATIPVTITLTGHTRLSGLDQAAVSVNFAQQRATGVLSVPVTALIATQGGNYAVQTAAAPHRLIPVTPGLFAAGYVQISGPGIYPGLQVTDSQG